jgi:hypothetical protein
MVRVIYVEQYGGWWKLSPDQWRELCERGAAGNGHMLPDKASLRRRSPLVGETNYNDGMGKKTYYPLRTYVLVYSPLDWESEDYQDALQELELGMRCTAQQKVST